MIARELSRYEGRFALLEKERFSGFGVSKANPCMLHSPLMFPSGPLRIELSFNASMRYRKLARELDVVFREVDEIFVALDEVQLKKLETAKNWAEENNVSGGHVMVSPDRLHDIEPQVTKEAIGALYGKGRSGAIYAPEWTFALTENAVQNGFDIYYDTPVTEIRKEDGRLRVRTPRGSLECRYIINAAGLFAEDIARMVGDEDIRLILTKGVMAILDKSSSHLLQNMVYGTYDREHSQMLTPTAHGNLLMGLGYFTTPENKGDTAVNPKKLEEVIEMCRILVPAVSGSEVITSFAGIRSENTKAQGGDFYIAQSEHTPGVIHAVIGSPGLTAAPAIAEHVLKVLSQAGMEMEEKKHFRGQRKGWPRFSSASLEERERMIADGEKTGHILCRCEQVSEAEIQEVVQRGADCMDAIKHLTRAGMGRCQGGFCGNFVLNQLSKELGIPPGQITKKGKESFYIMQKGDCNND